MKPSVTILITLCFLMCLQCKAADLQPKVLGSWPGVLSSWDGNVVLSGQHLYISSGSDGLHVLDAANPTQPKEIASFQEDIRLNALALGEGLIYAGAYRQLNPVLDQTHWTGMEIIDIHDPTRLRRIGSYQITPNSLRESVTAISYSSNYVYLCETFGENLQERRGRLDIVDVKDPTTPERVGRYESSGGIWGVATLGNLAFLAAGTSGLQILDLSNPAAPRAVGSYDSGAEAVNLALLDNYVCLVDSNSELTVIDVMDPSKPHRIGSCTLQTYGDPITAVAISNKRAFLAAGFSGLHIVDLSNAPNPVQIGRFLPHGHSIFVAASGDLAFLTDGTSKDGPIGEGLIVLDLTNLASPKRLGQLEISSEVRDAAEVTVSGNFAYLAGGPLDVVDVRNPATPMFQARGALLPTRTVTVDGNYAAVAHTQSGVYFLDVSNPANLTKIVDYPTKGAVQSVFLTNGFAYLADEDDFVVLDLSNLAIPKRVGSYAVNHYIPSLAVSGNVAYLAVDGLWSGIEVINLVNKQNPQLIANFSAGLGPRHIILSGHYLYLAALDGLYVVDVADPSKPKQVGHCPIRGETFKVTVQGSYAYVAGSAGLTVVDITNPAAPWVAGGNSGLDLLDVKASEGRIFAATRREGLVVLDLFRPVQLELLPHHPDYISLRLRVQANPGLNFTIQRSTNLVKWEDWRQLTGGTEPAVLLDTDGILRGPLSFFRAVGR